MKNDCFPSPGNVGWRVSGWQRLLHLPRQRPGRRLRRSWRHRRFRWLGEGGDPWIAESQAQLGPGRPGMLRRRPLWPGQRRRLWKAWLGDLGNTNRTARLGLEWPWNALECLGMPWNALECLGMPWNALECLGMPWNALECLGMPWNASGCVVMNGCEMHDGLGLSQIKHCRHGDQSAPKPW